MFAFKRACCYYERPESPNFDSAYFLGLGLAFPIHLATLLSVSRVITRRVLEVPGQPRLMSPETVSPLWVTNIASLPPSLNVARRNWLLHSSWLTSYGSVHHPLIFWGAVSWVCYCYIFDSMCMLWDLFFLAPVQLGEVLQQQYHFF